MATRKKSAGGSRKLDVDILVALGAERLAELVLAQADSDPVFARTVRMALTAKDDAGALAHEIDKRLKTIRRSRGFVEWDKVKPLARELDQLRQTIAGPLAQASPDRAVEQMRLFLSIADSIFERVDDSSGVIGTVFRNAGEDLGRLWGHSHAGDVETLAAEVLQLIETDDYGVFDELPDAISPALGRDGRAAMRRLLVARQGEAPPDQWRRYDFRVGWLLPKLADLDDDVDAYIATVDQTRQNALLNAEVAKRLIAHDRAGEALEWIDAPTDRGHNDRALAALKLQALEKLKRKDEAQAQRRLIFERWLDADALRAWLKALPAFEDFEAEQGALDYVRDQQPILALAFLIGWPDLMRAARLVRDHHAQMDGRAYDVLRPSAETLSASDPFAATLLYRRLVTGVLDRANSKYYPYAARDLGAASSLADLISDDRSLASHGDWVAELRRAHGRKVGFWSLVRV